MGLLGYVLGWLTLIAIFVFQYYKIGVRFWNAKASKVEQELGYGENLDKYSRKGKLRHRKLVRLQYVWLWPLPAFIMWATERYVAARDRELAYKMRRRKRRHL